MYELSVPWTGFKSVVLHLLLYLCAWDVASKVRTRERCVNSLGGWSRGAGARREGARPGRAAPGSAAFAAGREGCVSWRGRACGCFWKVLERAPRCLRQSAGTAGRRAGTAGRRAVRGAGRGGTRR